MIGFKGRPHKNHRSIDGFIPSNRRNLDKPANDTLEILDEIGSKKDGLNTQKQGSVDMPGAIENRASLPGYGYDSGRPIDLKNNHKTRNFGFKKAFKVAGSVLAVLILSTILVGGFLFGKGWLAARKILQGGGNSATLFNTDIAPEKLKGEGDGRVNVLLTGIGGGNRDGAYLTDTILIASIDPVAKDIALLSVPRDLWVDVPDFWSMKINAAFSSARELALENGSTDQEAQEAGFATLEETIELYIGVPIHYHALVNFQAFKDGVDAVGGLTVNVKEPLYDYVLAGENDGEALIADRGLQNFDGRTALLYAQSRSTSSDFARGERQRELVIALKEKVLSSGTFSNPNTVSKLLDALGDNVTVNATLQEIMRMYEITKDVPTSSIVTVGFTDEPNILVRTDTVNELSIVRPRAGLKDFSEIQSFVRNTLRDPFLKSENATIAVLNGSGIEGLATQKADELKSYGYNVTIIDSAPTSDYQTTIIYDRTNGVKKYTRNYLENRLGAKVSPEPTSSNPILVTADFIVVLGANETTTSTN